MKKNTLYIILAMLLACVNTAWAQLQVPPTPGDQGIPYPEPSIIPANVVATINNGTTTKGYETLAEAIAEVEDGQTIQLESDIALTNKVEMKGGNYTIDFNGHGISWNGITSNDEYQNSQSAIDFIESNTQVALLNFKVNGVAYPVFVELGANNVSLTITAPTTGNSSSGRALIYNKGNQNTFDIREITFTGLNNEAGLSEEFACFVDEGSSNLFILNGGTYTGKVSNLNTGGNNQSEHLVDFRGKNSKLILENNASYTCNPIEQGGLLSDAASILADGNMIYIGESVKTTQMDDWVNAINELIYSDAAEHVDNADEDCYKLVVAPAIIDVRDTEDNTETYHSLEEAFASPLLGDGATVDLRTNAVLTTDIEVPIGPWETIIIDTNGSFSILPSGGKLLLQPGAFVDYDAANAAQVFGVTDPNTSIQKSDDHTYTAANIYSEELDYGLIEDALTLGLSPEQEIILQNNISLADDIECVLADGENYTLTCGTYSLTSNGGKIKLATGATIYSDKAGLNVFAAADGSSAIIMAKTADGKYAYSVMSNTDDAVARIGDVYFADFGLAIEAVQAGETIELLKDIETAGRTTIDKGGFTIDGKGHSLICNYEDLSGIHPENTVTDPEKEYRNGEGALYFTAAGGEVKVKDLNIKGFAYAIDVEGDNIVVSMVGGSTYGRAALNVHGEGGSFTFKEVDVHGLNNEKESANEAFAAFVLDEDANENRLTIENCPVTASIANNNGYNTEKFIELRGENNKVFIKGSGTTYTCTPEGIGGFTNKTNDLTNDEVYFDEAAKATFQPMFAAAGKLTIIDIQSHEYNGMYPLATTRPVVTLKSDLTDTQLNFETIEEAFESDKFNPEGSSVIKLLGNITLAADINPETGNGGLFTIDLNGMTLKGGSFHINLKPGAIAEVIGGATDDTKNVFATTDPSLVIIQTDAFDEYEDPVGIDYTAANCKFDDIALLFDEAINNINDDDDYAGNSIIALETNIALDNDITLNKSAKLNFQGNEFTGGKNILLADDVSITTDEQTDIFKAATDGHFITEKANADGTFTYTASATEPIGARVRNENTGILYYTLQTAVSAASEGDELSIITTIENDEQVDITKSITIDGRGQVVQIVQAEHPETYINMLPLFNLKDIAEGSEVTIKNITMSGYAYAVNVEHSVQGVTVNLYSDNSADVQFAGRAVINNWGSNNTFNVDQIDADTYNLEPEPQPGSPNNYEKFAAFVDNKSYPEDENQYEAKNNTYNISNTKVGGIVGDDNHLASYFSTAATAMFIDLRGSGAKVNVRNTRYIDLSDIDRVEETGGFTNSDYVDLLVNSNQVWFDEYSKEIFDPLVRQMEGIGISANQDTNNDNLYPLERINGGVLLILTTEDPNTADLTTESYHYKTLKEAIESDFFKADKDPQITLISDQAIDEDITLPESFTENTGFTINRTYGGVKHDITAAEGKGIILPALVTATVMDGEDGAVDGIFKPADDKFVICSEVFDTDTEKSKTYVAANVRYLMGGDEEMSMYYVLDNLISENILSDQDVVELMTDVTMTGDIDLRTITTDDDDDETTPEVPVFTDGTGFTLNFNGKNLNGDKNILLPDGVSVTTDRQAIELFEPAEDNRSVLETDNGDGTYTYTVFKADEVPGDAVARIDNRYFTTLQGATGVAQDGETIYVLKNIETDKIVNVTTAVTIEGQGYEVKNTKQAHDAVAFNITAKGDVTINKLNVYNPNGDAFELNDGFNGKLTFNNSTIQSSRRAIDVQDVAEGFGLTLNSTDLTVIFKEKDTNGNDTYDVDDTKNPEEEYVNMISTGVYFANDPVAANVTIDKSSIKGFSYGVNVSDNSGKLNVTLSDGTFYGRAVVNNWGEGSTFNIDNMAVNGLNNENNNNPDADPERFATIVDNSGTSGTTGEANYNNYNINNSTFKATVSDAASDAATEKFIELRGNSARVKITGNTTYEYTGSDASRGGFTNDDFVQNLVEGNKVWFDETAKSFFDPIVDAYNNETYGHIGIQDVVDETNLYPLGRKVAAVAMHVPNDELEIDKWPIYYYESLEKALNSPLFTEYAQIDLLKDVELDEDYTVSENFTLNLSNYDITGDGKLLLEPATMVDVLRVKDNTDNLFGVAEGYEDKAKILITVNSDEVDNVQKSYTAGNIYYDNIYSYDMLDRVLDAENELISVTDDEDAPHDYGYIRLEMDIKLDESQTLPINGNETTPDKLYIDYNGKTLDPNGNSIVLKPGVEVFVNGDATDLFSSADPEYTVVVDEVNVTHANENGEDITFTKKYYLMKDGLAVTVAPATYCGHEQEPTVVVKKRVESTTTPGTYEWKTLVAGTDYTVTLVPKENEDDYIAAKTYANSVIIEGITFQGRRKADFIINPRNINDVTVTGNEQPYRASGFTAAQIAELIAAEYGCIVSEHKVDDATNMTYELKKKDATTETPDYQVTVTLPDGVEKLTEIGTYKNIIKLQALEGATGENAGTQNFVGSRYVDFVILSGDGINIADVLVTSKAVYTSQAQAPAYDLLEVVYNNGGTRVVLEQNQFTIEYHGVENDYVNAKNYSNAITLHGTMNAAGTNNTLKFYGSVNMDYVIAPRDLADTEMGDDKGLVTINNVKDMDWMGNELTPNINTDANNNIALTMEYQATPDNGTYKLIAADYTYTVEPSPMKDPGEYKVIFTGRGNFTGMTEVKIAVLKDISTVDADIALQVIPGVNETNYTGGQGLKPSELQGIVVTDGTQTLIEGEHYTITVKGQSDMEYTETNPIKSHGVYFATITGKYPYYKEEKKKEFPAVFEYYTLNADDVTPAENKFGIHVTSGIDRTANVGALDGIAADPAAEGLIIDPTKTVQLGAKAPYTFVELTIAGIDDNAFNGDNNLHYVDASALTGYEPSSLSRNADGPFNGIAKQAIVYLDGDDVIGENYVYQTAAGDWRADEFKIYDDTEGNQQGFEDEDYAWEIINIHEFHADNLTNTRKFTADQHYTTCLPYDLTLPETLKAYTLTAASETMFGFREISGDALKHFKPYVLIPTATGNLLSTKDVTVYVTPTANKANQNWGDEDVHSGYQLKGSNIYLGAASTEPSIGGLYIMQSQNQWKKIQGGTDWGNACVLPMRAYISTPDAGGSREFMGAKFIDGVKETTTDMAGDDWNDAEVYDLQGRKVDTTQQMRKGVYIVNGQKRIRK